jgi:hypothetical protein
MMDLVEGFQIERPDVFIPWGAPEAQFPQLFDRLQLRRVAPGYFATRCVSLGGLSHELGFLFIPRGQGVLAELEFSRTSFRELEKSFAAFQRHLEATFGAPMVSTPGEKGYPSHAWRFAGADVVHYVADRFGLEEHVRIKRTTTGLVF